MTKAPDKLQDLRRRIYRKAKSDLRYRASPLPDRRSAKSVPRRWTVAVKILPPHPCDNPETKQRFEPPVLIDIRAFGSRHKIRV